MFCDNKAFNPSYCDPLLSLHEQILKGIEFHAIRYRRAQKFLVYFQPFSNTYAPLNLLKKKYEEALSFPDVIGLVIGTRPDCIDDEKLQYLAELSKRYYIQVEYGVETHDDMTLQRIHRGHSSAIAIEAIKKTHDFGITTGAHYILGLPGETEEGMMNMASVISGLPLDTVKFHQLQIIKGTAMEVEFLKSPDDFHRFGIDDYIDFIIRFTERLHPRIVIERFTGEVPPRFIKDHNLGLLRFDEVLRKIEKEFEKRNTRQGKYYA
jgi:radical SAM protein (TIGR01212 family)